MYTALTIQKSKDLNLKLCKIWGSHHSVTESSSLLGCGTVSLDETFPTYQRHSVLPDIRCH